MDEKSLALINEILEKACHSARALISERDALKAQNNRLRDLSRRLLEIVKPFLSDYELRSFEKEIGE